MKKILVADDELDIVKVISSLLRRNGFEVVVAYDGGEALEMAERHRPDLVLLDIQMPASIGLSVLSNLKSSPGTANIPVLIISGFDSTESRSEASKAGATGFISKPFSLKKLLSKIQDNLMDRE